MTEYAQAQEDMMSIPALQGAIKDKKVSTMEEVEKYLKEEAAKFEIYEDQVALGEIPLRKFTDEEAALIMKYKLEKSP